MASSKAPTERNKPAQSMCSSSPQNPSPEEAGQMPDGWEVCRFDAVAQVISGKNQKDVESSSGVFPIYGSGGTFGRATSYLCEPGTTVVGRKGTINSPIFVTERFWNVDTAFGLYPLKCDTLIPRFLYFFCCLFDFTSLDKSTTIPSLAKRDIEAIPIPLPPLAEQKRIVAKIEELFSELDAGEESLRRARRQLGVYRQSLLKQAFEGKLTAPWRAQHPDLLESPDQLLARIQAERQARYQQQLKEWEETGRNGSKPRKPAPIDSISSDEASQLETLPPEWVWVSFSALCDFFNGDRSKNYPNRSEYVAAGVAWINTGHIEPDGSLSVERMNFISREKFDSLSGGRIEPGDLVYCLRGATFGKTAFVSPFTEGAIASSLMIIRPVNVNRSRVIYRYLVSPLGKQQLQRFDNGSAQPNLSAASVALYQFPLCSLPEQQEIVRLLDEQFEVIEQNEREIDAALKRSEALRQSILKKAFTGQLVPQDPTDEPASALLVCIQAERNTTAKASNKKSAAGRKRNS